MTYQVIARKYRPQTFNELIGQAPIVQTLRNAIENNLVAHAYIFSGTRGVGKTTTARILAKALNCEKGPTPTPCGQCPPCTEITAANAVDVLEIDAASNRGIDEIRQLRETVRYLPARDRYKVFIIDEAHMLTTEAFNALLKTLEEPPARVLFVLATTEPHKLPPTIHSRCQSFHFRTISFQEVLRMLEEVARKEEVKVDAEALAVMTRAAEGSMRDALSILDQTIAYCGKSISAAQVRELLGVVEDDVLHRLVDAIATQSSEGVVQLVDSLVRDGYNLQHFCREALRHIRNLLLVRIGGMAAELAEAAGAEKEKLEAAAAPFSEEDLLRFFHVLMTTEGELRWSPHPRLHLELGLLKLVQAERLVPLEEILAEISQAESIPSRPSPPPSRPAARSAQLSNPSPPAASAAPATRAPAPPPAEAEEPALDNATVDAIKNAVYGRSKFLGSFVDHVARWEHGKEGVNLWFTPENRTLSQMLDRKQHSQLEKVVSQVVGQPIKVQAKVGAGEGAPPKQRRPAARAAKSESPVVKALLERFGGSLQVASEVPPPGKRKE